MSTTIHKTAITPRRDQDFPEWYQQVIRAAELAEALLFARLNLGQN